MKLFGLNSKCPSSEEKKSGNAGQLVNTIVTVKYGIML